PENIRHRIPPDCPPRLRLASLGASTPPFQGGEEMRRLPLQVLVNRFNEGVGPAVACVVIAGGACGADLFECHAFFDHVLNTIATGPSSIASSAVSLSTGAVKCSSRQMPMASKLFSAAPMAPITWSIQK